MCVSKQFYEQKHTSQIKKTSDKLSYAQSESILKGKGGTHSFRCIQGMWKHHPPETCTYNQFSTKKFCTYKQLSKNKIPYTGRGLKSKKIIGGIKNIFNYNIFNYICKTILNLCQN